MFLVPPARHLGTSAVVSELPVPRRCIAMASLHVPAAMLVLQSADWRPFSAFSSTVFPAGTCPPRIPRLQPWMQILVWQDPLSGLPGHYPANMIHRPNVVLMLGQRRRRWPNIKTTLDQCIVFAGYSANTGPIVGSMLGQRYRLSFFVERKRATAALKIKSDVMWNKVKCPCCYYFFVRDVWAKQQIKYVYW